MNILPDKSSVAKPSIDLIAELLADYVACLPLGKLGLSARVHLRRLSPPVDYPPRIHLRTICGRVYRAGSALVLNPVHRLANSLPARCFLCKKCLAPVLSLLAHRTAFVSDNRHYQTQKTQLSFDFYAPFMEGGL